MMKNNDDLIDDHLAAPMKSTSDFHIHLHHSPCTSKEMTPGNILRKASEVGLSRVGLVNHLHPDTPLALFDMAREEIALVREAFSGTVLMGGEAELLDQNGSTTLTGECYEHVDYILLAMGHTQLPWVKLNTDLAPEAFLIKETESLLKAISGHRVDIVAHPYIYGFLFKDAPKLAQGLRPHKIPADLIDALAKALIKNNTRMEFHCRDLIIRPERLGGDSFVRSYMRLLGQLREKGVLFTAGSDAHYLDQIGRTIHAPSWANSII